MWQLLDDDDDDHDYVARHVAVDHVDHVGCFGLLSKNMYVAAAHHTLAASGRDVA
jgi:hypothetical protein